MFDTVFGWLLDKAPLLASCLFLVFVVWQVAKAYFKRFKPMETNVKELKAKSNCVKHEVDIIDLKSIVRNIEKILLKGDNTLMDQLSITRSPRQLSELGMKLYIDSGCQKLLTENEAYYIDKLEARCPLTALDVETESHSLLLSLSDEIIFYPIKNFIYKNPKYLKKDIDINTICFVMSLELRNLYLLKHPEIIENSNKHELQV